MVKIRVEISPTAENKLSGVGNYTKLLAESLYKNNNVELDLVNYNFLNRQPTPKINTKVNPTENHLVPLRVYAKIQSYNVAPAFDIFKKPVDLTIFTNYATWPTVKSKYRAVTVHDLTYLYHPELVEDKNLEHLKRVVPRSLKEADIILTVSNCVKEEIIKEFRTPAEKFVVTPIPPDEKFQIKNNADVFKEYDIKTNKYIYSIGTIEPRKDLPTLIDAYLKLPKKIRQEYSLVIAGGMGWKSEASKEAVENAIESGENVLYLGYIDQKLSNALYQQASLYVSASLYEGFGMPVLESIVCETPAVISDIPIYREAGGNISMYAKPKNSADFAKKIQLALENKKFHEFFAKNRATHLSNFSWKKNAENIVKKVESLEK